MTVQVKTLKNKLVGKVMRKEYEFNLDKKYLIPSQSYDLVVRLADPPYERDDVIQLLLDDEEIQDGIRNKLNSSEHVHFHVTFLRKIARIHKAIVKKIINTLDWRHLLKIVKKEEKTIITDYKAQYFSFSLIRLFSKFFIFLPHIFKSFKRVNTSD